MMKMVWFLHQCKCGLLNKPLINTFRENERITKEKSPSEMYCLKKFLLKEYFYEPT